MATKIDPAVEKLTKEFRKKFDDVRSEIEKSNRFGRNFSLLEVELAAIDALERRLGERGSQEWLAGIVKRLRNAMRSADILAADGEGCFLVLLSETDTLGRRIRTCQISSP